MCLRAWLAHQPASIDQTPRQSEPTPTARASTTATARPRPRGPGLLRLDAGQRLLEPRLNHLDAVKRLDDASLGVAILPRREAGQVGA